MTINNGRIMLNSNYVDCLTYSRFRIHVCLQTLFNKLAQAPSFSSNGKRIYKFPVPFTISRGLGF